MVSLLLRVVILRDCHPLDLPPPENSSLTKEASSDVGLVDVSDGSGQQRSNTMEKIDFKDYKTAIVLQGGGTLEHMNAGS